MKINDMYNVSKNIVDMSRSNGIFISKDFFENINIYKSLGLEIL